MILEKEKGTGRDFNNMVYDEAKKAMYFFEYIRTQDKLYKYEIEMK